MIHFLGAVEADIVGVLVAGFGEDVVKAGAGHYSASGDGERHPADALDLFLAHAGLNLCYQGQVAVDIGISGAATGR
ncbi:hypothetical protein D3C84_819820 [compost metagenome]